MIAHNSPTTTAKIAGMIANTGRRALQGLLLLTAICVFVPFYPLMPEAGLDQSWKYGMNQAVAQGLAFGREIIFTFGPYSAVYTKMYHPATDSLMLTGGLWLGVTYGCALLYLTRKAPWAMALAICAVLAGLMYLRDPLLLSYPLLVGIASLSLADSHEREPSHRWLTLAFAAALFSSLGLLPLVKGSVLILCGAIALLTLALFAARKQWDLAATATISIFVSLVFFWLLSGQLLSDLPRFLFSMFPIASGYTEAMAFAGRTSQIVLYLIFAFALLVILVRHEHLDPRDKLFSFCLFFLFLFVAFKAAFVRHDGHAIIAGTSALIAALLFLLTFKSKRYHIVLIPALIAWAHIDSQFVRTSTESFSSGITSTFRTAWQGIRNRVSNDAWLRDEFETANRRLSSDAGFPSLEGTTDIYSFNQSHLIASGNKWAPRPILQSYSAYTPSLVDKNREYLVSRNAPDNIIFTVEPIDGRLPSLEDGASWPALLNNYRPFSQKNNFLFLSRHVTDPVTLEPLSTTETSRLEETVNVPNSGELVFVKLELKQTLLGRLTTVLFKPPQLKISLNLANGEKKEYRIISGMANSGFLISPLVESTDEFAALFGDSRPLPDKAVKSFSVATAGASNFWKDEFEVQFEAMKERQLVDISGLYDLEAFVGDVAPHLVSNAKTCDGNIDAINGASANSGPFTSPKLISVRGWLAKSGAQGLLPDSTLIALRDENGATFFIGTRQDSRPDVGDHFKNRALDASGFVTTADVSKLRGKYFVGLAFKEGKRVMVCPQFNVPVTLGGRASNEQH